MARSRGAGFSSSTRGLDKVERKLRYLENMPPGYAAVVGVTGSRGVYKRKRGPDLVETRDAKKNIMIHRIQKGINGRNVVALVERRRPNIARLWLSASRAVARTGRPGAFLAAARTIGDAMVKAIHAGVKRGEIRGVLESTQKRKDREGLRPSLPPMVRTGQFLRSLISDVVSGKPRWH